MPVTSIVLLISSVLPPDVSSTAVVDGGAATGCDAITEVEDKVSEADSVALIETVLNSEFDMLINGYSLRMCPDESIL